MANRPGMAPRDIFRSRFYVQLSSWREDFSFNLLIICFIAWNKKISNHFEMFRSPYVDVGWIPTYRRLAPPFQQIIDIWESWRGLFVGLGSERVNDCSEVMLSKNIPSGFRSDGIRLLFQSRRSRRLLLTRIIIQANFQLHNTRKRRSEMILRQCWVYICSWHWGIVWHFIRDEISAPGSSPQTLCSLSVPWTGTRHMICP